MTGPDLDLSRAFDDCFAGEHDGPPVAHHVARGRRYVRLRRTVVSLVVTGVVAAVGTGVAVVDRSPSADRNPPANESTRTPEPEPTVDTEFDTPENDQDLARLHGWAVDGRTGALLLADGLEVLDRVDLPDGAGFADRSYGLDVVRNGNEHWVWLPWDAPADEPATPGADAEQWKVETAPVAGTTFRQWLDGVVAGQVQKTVPELPAEIAEAMEQEEKAYPAVRSDRRGNYTLRDGVEVLEQVDNPMGLRAPFSSTALRLRFRGAESWWLVSPLPSGPFVEAYQKDTTFEEWLSDELDVEWPSVSVNGPMPPLYSELVDGLPVLRPNVDLVKRVDNPLGVELPAKSVAYRVTFKGREWWYLWEIGPSGYYAYRATRVAGDGYATFEDWLAAQRTRARW